jgi:uncharacterized protein (DUF433 family)
LTSSIPTDIKYIVRTPGVYGGKPCIEGHRIAVHDIAVAHKQGYTPEQIVTEYYPSLTLPQVYAALLYYFEHKDEIDREIAEDDSFIREQAAKDTSPQKERFRQMWRERKAQLGLEQ